MACVSKWPETVRETVKNRVDERLIRMMGEKLSETGNIDRGDYFEQARIFKDSVDRLHIMKFVKGNR
jgi:hypothetical protein